jgi:hypothetical protein
VDLDPRHVGRDRRRLQIVEASGRRSDQHDIAVDAGGIERAGDQVRGGQVPPLVALGIADRDPTGAIDRHLELADFHRV